jgi:hypothetical protein
MKKARKTNIQKANANKKRQSYIDDHTNHLAYEKIIFGL